MLRHSSGVYPNDEANPASGHLQLKTGGIEHHGGFTTDVLAHQTAGKVFTTAAAGRETQLGLYGLKTIGTGTDGGTNVRVGNALANTDDHGGVSRVIVNR